jgi:hypothetical protein
MNSLTLANNAYKSRQYITAKALYSQVLDLDEIGDKIKYLVLVRRR